VLKDSIGFIGINRDEKVLFKVFSYDNGPDDLSEGYFRIITKNKIGFADSTGKIIITPRFSAAYPFREGLAAFCNDCKLESNGEHSLWVDGKWGFVNKLGLVVIKPQFEKVFVGFANNIALVVLNGKKVKINKMGNVIEEVKE
jgi:hypothetical protein